MVAALFVRCDRVLLCHRHPSRRWFPNVWDLPGGHIAADETPTEALVREVREELGVVIMPDSGIPNLVHDPNTELRLQVWFVRTWTGTVQNVALEEHDDIGWFSREEVQTLRLAHSALREAIAAALLS